MLGTASGSMTPTCAGVPYPGGKVLVGLSFRCQVQRRVDAISCPAIISDCLFDQVSALHIIRLGFQKTGDACYRRSTHDAVSSERGNGYFEMVPAYTLHALGISVTREGSTVCPGKITNKLIFNF